MFGGVGASQYDLQFRCFGIPVRVTPWFFLSSVLFGRSWLEDGKPEYLISWVICMFMSILVHEMGHAVTANIFGWPPSIILYHMGGLAMFHPDRNYSPWRSMAVSFAGPLAGFFLFATVIVIDIALHVSGHPPNDVGRMAIAQLEFVNLWWGLVNLLPVFPLDGGRISQELCQLILPRNGFAIAARIGMVVAGAAAAYFFSHHLMFAGIMFAYFCLANYEILQQSRGRGW